MYNAHFGTKPQIQIGSSENGACDGSLYVKGIILGEITQKSTRVANAIITEDCLDILGRIPRDQQSNVTNLPDIIWRTLCADRDDREELALLDYRSAMLYLLGHSSEVPISGDLETVKIVPGIDVEEILETEPPKDVKNFLGVVLRTVWNMATNCASSTVAVFQSFSDDNREATTNTTGSWLEKHMCMDS